MASLSGTEDDIIIDIRGFEQYEQRLAYIKYATDFVFKNIDDPHQQLVLVYGPSRTWPFQCTTR